MASVRNQTEQDYEHIFINDDEGHGLHWANKQIYEYSSRIGGKWVYILDDDDFLTDMDFIKELKNIHTKYSPHLIICKGYIGDSLYPQEHIWKGNKVIRGTLGSPNFVVRKSLFIRHSKHWDNPKAADYYFINSIFHMIDKRKIYWFDKAVFNAPVGNCEPEIKIKKKEYGFYSSYIPN